MNRIPGCSGDIRHYIAIGSKQGVDHTRFSDIGLSYDRETQNFFFWFGVLDGQQFHHLIQHLSTPTTRQRGHEKSPVKSQTPEFIGLQLPGKVIDLIDYQYDGFRSEERRVGK